MNEKKIENDREVFRRYVEINPFKGIRSNMSDKDIYTIHSYPFI